MELIRTRVCGILPGHGIPFFLPWRHYRADPLISVDAFPPVSALPDRPLIYKTQEILQTSLLRVTSVFPPLFRLPGHDLVAFLSPTFPMVPCSFTLNHLMVWTAYGLRAMLPGHHLTPLLFKIPSTSFFWISQLTGP